MRFIVRGCFMYYIIAFLSVDVMTFREIRHLATNKKTPGGVITLPLFWHAPTKDQYRPADDKYKIIANNTKPNPAIIKRNLVNVNGFFSSPDLSESLNA